MAKFDAEAMAQRLARNVMDLNSDAISWDEFKRRYRAAPDLVARGESNIARNDFERRYRQVQEHLNQILRDRSALGVEASTVLRCIGR
ncbi:MAG: hypothetical protein IH606_06450 [Burkholderiales bacterium]|nr:hypothetical protein [Burkholderiales bacterium]